MKNLLVNYAAGIRSQGNLDLGMSFFEDGKQRGQDARRRPIGSTYLQRTALLLRGTVQIAPIDLFELGQNRLDVLEKLITVVRKFDPLRVSCEKSKVKSVFQRFQVFREGRLAYMQIVGSLRYIQMLRYRRKSGELRKCHCPLLGDYESSLTRSQILRQANQVETGITKQACLKRNRYATFIKLIRIRK